jgi:hypothetical protein
MNRRNPVTISVVIFAIIAATMIVVAIVLQTIEARRTATIDILVTPKSSSIKVGDRSFSNGQHSIEPGSYQVSISKEGFKPYTSEITVESGKTVEVRAILQQADGGIDWYAEHPEDDAIYTALSDKEYEDNSHIISDKFPIVKVLPIEFANFANNYSEYIEYRIDYKISDDGEKITLVITDATGGNRDRALQKIRDKGFNPDDYEVEYNYVPKQTK